MHVILIQIGVRRTICRAGLPRAGSRDTLVCKFRRRPMGLNERRKIKELQEVTFSGE